MTVTPLEQVPHRSRATNAATGVPRTARKLDAAFQAPYLLSLTGFAVMLIAITVMNPPAWAWDFRAFYDGGRDYLHLHSPYVSGSLAQLTTQQNFVYPLPFAALFAPVALVPYPVAAALFIVVGAGLLALALWILGVRDWRVYAAVAIGMPTATAIGLGTITPLLTLLLAFLWRYRDRPKIAAPILAILVLAKVFLWPVGLWLLFTRRFRTLVAAAIAAVMAVLLSTVPLGFGALAHYPTLLRSLSALEGPTSFSLSSMATALTGASWVGSLTTAAAGVLVLTMLRVAQRRDDQRVFRLSIVASLALSPIVWNHYLVLLYVPLALVRPRFSPAWLAGAWVIGVGVLDGKTLAVASAAVWIAILVQAGVVTDVVRWERVRMRVPKSAIPFGASILQLAALLWLLGALTAAVPGVAALMPASKAGSASGTARLHLDKASNEICWKILTTGLPARARAEIVETRPSRRILVDRPIAFGQSVGCAGYGTAHRNLAMPFKRGHVQLVLSVMSSSGRLLLSGSVVWKLQELKVRAAADVSGHGGAHIGVARIAEDGLPAPRYRSQRA
jgi:hypothetical protein